MVLLREDAVGVLIDLGKTDKWLDHLYLVLEVIDPHLLLAH